MTLTGQVGVASERDSLSKMAGGLLREFGVLYLTFGILDIQLAELEKLATFDGWWWVKLFGVSFVSMLLGAGIERWRKM